MAYDQIFKQNEKLFAAAAGARAQSYSPYSKFAVGAALVGGNGEVFTGCNVENISFGLTICAERAAIATAVAQGVRKFERIVIVSDSADPVVPCGACRQVMAEFAPALKIVSRTLANKTAELNLADLLPIPQQGILG